jgi:hypothetical protein
MHAAFFKPRAAAASVAPGQVQKPVAPAKILSRRAYSGVHVEMEHVKTNCRSSICWTKCLRSKAPLVGKGDAKHPVFVVQCTICNWEEELNSSNAKEHVLSHGAEHPDIQNAVKEKERISAAKKAGTAAAFESLVKVCTLSSLFSSQISCCRPVKLKLMDWKKSFFLRAPFRA